MGEIDYSRIITIILGGGRGERLYPLTAERAKPAVPIGGKYRIIDVPVSNCINANLMKMFILTQFNSASLNRHINSAYRFDSYSQGFIETLSAEQSRESEDWFLGTADAVRQVRRHFVTQSPKYILILSGDQLYSMDFFSLIKSHEKSEAKLTVATIPVTREDATGFGIMKVDNSGRINTFYEKPKEDELLDEMACSIEDLTSLGFEVEEDKNYLASMGIYLFNTDFLVESLKNPKHTDFGKHVIPHSIKNVHVNAYLYKGYWEDIGTIKSYFKANLDMTKRKPLFDLYEKKLRLYSNPRFLPPAKFFNCSLENTLVSPGVVLDQVKAKDSIIGLRSMIDPGTTLEKVIMFGSDWYDKEAPGKENTIFGIGSVSVIKNCILDKNCWIGKNVKILNKDKIQHLNQKNYCIRDGIVIVKKNAVIADNTVI
ncbi:glucose-1-phosphate adenylyltransferase [Candidatus Riflebacteria bacterium]